MGNLQDIYQLFEKYLNNSCSPEEAARLVRIIRSGKRRTDIERVIEKHLENGVDSAADEVVLSRIFAKLDLGEGEKKKGKTAFGYAAVIAAAAILIAATTGLYVYLNSLKTDVMPESANITNDAAPGGNRATLMLEGGESIALSSDQPGIVITDKDISYSDGTKLLTSRCVAHKLVTPKGGQYQITLHDGTKVWLNALSTLTYPKQFATNERVVELEGEAYFEVSTWLEGDRRVPFRVKTKALVAEVLGTQLNINAYEDESTTTTTLLEGAVRVITPQSSASLKPGQQCKAGANGLTVTEVDVETVVDWKNGDFIFADENLKSIMRKVSRWYDVAIVYESKLPDERYNGQISRHKNLSEVLRILELSGGLASKIGNDTVFLSSKHEKAGQLTNY
ncbi:FecR family protein [Parapedobacter deserti]|uniref:FecR family protein n=1 Tax=Parapedobacter deserti TaxID=1912957 RepID=A0ABV7JLF3_9SPHI